MLLVLCWLTLAANAQNAVNKKAQAHFDDAQTYLEQRVYDEGIRYLELAVNADPKFQLAYIQLGDVYRRIKNHTKAVENYIKAISSASSIEARIYYALGESELLTGNYESSRQHLRLFQQKYTGTDDTFIGKTKKYLLDCDFALTAIKSPVPYKAINMGEAINSIHRDYFPALTADSETLIYTRVVNGNEDFLIASKKDGNWQKAVPLSTQINTPDFNEGAQSISPDGKYLFFTGCNRPDGLGRCDIYVSRKEGLDWGKPRNLGKMINSEYWDSQPSISPDGNTLYFVSNRPGGFGGYDIWKSDLTDGGQWTNPVNLGPHVNTAYDENTPFMHADGKTLYFSSDGWPGFGNKDIFYSRMTDQGQFLTAPTNLGYPINTFNEEIGLIVSADGNEGLFSSNMANGFGDLDIYSFQLPQNIRPLPVTYVKGMVRDRETKAFLAANVLVIDLDKKVAVFNDYTAAETGDFLAVMPAGSKYAFNVDAEGYLFNSAHFEIKKTDIGKPYEVEILLDKIKIGSHVALQNVFFDTNQYTLLPASIIELELLVGMLKNNPTIEIEIQGHTDNVGDLKLNEQLSNDRAKAVYDFLKANGIAGKRLTFKGYAATKPRADNANEAGRKQNRRTEVMITKT